MKRWFLVGVMVYLSLGFALTVMAQELAPAQAPVAHQFEVQRWTLPNGLKVWCQPRPDSTSVVTLLVFRVGGRNETSENNGVSHFVEHMLFTGTERWDENEIKQRIARRGGKWNGWTSDEHTVYYAEMAAQDFSLALDWIAEIGFHPTFPADKVDKERNVIFEEKFGKYGWIINIAETLGFGYDLWREIEKQIFPDSTLINRIVGQDDSLEKTDREVLLNYYRQYYIPNNAVLLIVGNVLPEAAQTEIERLFGQIPGGSRAPLPETPKFPNDGPHTAITRGPFPTDQNLLVMGTRTFGQLDPDVWPFEVLSELLDRSLNEEVRYKRGLVYSLWSYNEVYADAGYFQISTWSEGKQRETIRQIIEAHVQAIRDGKIDAQQFADAQTALKGRWALSMERNFSRAGWLENWALLLADDQPIPNYNAQIDAVTPVDLTRIVTTYFTPQRSFVGMHIPILTVNSGLWIGGILLLLLVGFIFYRRRRRKMRKLAP